MNDPLQALLEISAKTRHFPPNSRYHGVDVAAMEDGAGRTILYLRRRFLPSPRRFVVQYEHTVQRGDRLDNLTAQCLGDPEQFWRICDANRVMHPDLLTAVPGRKIRIAFPEGLGGASDD